MYLHVQTGNYLQTSQILIPWEITFFITGLVSEETIACEHKVKSGKTWAENSTWDVTAVSGQCQLLSHNMTPK